VGAFLACLEDNIDEEECVLLSLIICNECNDDEGCEEDGNPCTAAACDNNTCGQAPTNEGGSCDGGAGVCEGGVCEPIAGECDGALNCVACNDGNGVCFDGTCSTPGTFSNSFDLSESLFRAYNSLLANVDACLIPDLFGGSRKCVEKSAQDIPPAVQGGVTFTDDGGGNWSVALQQDLVFEINAAIAGATVDITTESQNTLNGTGTGDVADSSAVTMDALAAPDDAFNMQVTASSGTVFCAAWNRIFQGAIVPCDSTTNCPDPQVPCGDCPLFAATSGGQTCGFLNADECDPTEMSDVICDAAALGPGAGATCVAWPQDTSVQSDAGCLVQLPKDADEGLRDMPPWTFATTSTPTSADECNQLNMQLGAGTSTVSGWYIGNPDEGSTQFTGLAGVQQP
jgi:hypothetical protein